MAGVFHMINHAFFKALPFLIRSVTRGRTGHAQDGRPGQEDEDNLHNNAHRLAVHRRIPAASGFWSKDLVLETALAPAQHGLGAGTFTALFLMGIITAFMTAFYMFRMWFMTFRGDEGEATRHAHGESPRSMTVPLIILAVFALGSGLGILFGLSNAITESLSCTLGYLHIHTHEGMTIAEDIFTNVWTDVSIVLTLLGMYIGWLMYCKKSVDPGRFNKNGESRLYKLLTKRYYFPRYTTPYPGSWDTAWPRAWTTWIRKS